MDAPEAFGLEKVMFFTVPGPPTAASARGSATCLLAARAWYSRSFCIGIIFFAPTPTPPHAAASATAVRVHVENRMTDACSLEVRVKEVCPGG